MYTHNNVRNPERFVYFTSSWHIILKITNCAYVGTSCSNALTRRVFRRAVRLPFVFARETDGACSHVFFEESDFIPHLRRLISTRVCRSGVLFFFRTFRPKTANDERVAPPRRFFLPGGGKRGGFGRTNDAKQNKKDTASHRRNSKEEI